MITIKFSKPVRKKDLKTYDEAKGFVKSTELWYGYEYKLDDILDRLRFGEAVISDNGVIINTNIIYFDKTILSGTHCTINDLIQACKGTEYNVPPVEVTRMGYVDEVNRRKYISCPVNGYWDYSANPIVMIKN